MSDEINKALESLDDKDMERVERLIQKLASQKEDKPKQRRVLPEKVAKKRKAAKRKKDLDNDDSQSNITKQKRRGRKESGRRKKATRRKKKMYASRESIELGKNENKFLEMREARLHKEDREFDKKVAKHEPTPRMGRTPTIEAYCKECGYYFDVSPGVVFNDPDDGPVFVCNDCATSRKR